MNYAIYKTVTGFRLHLDESQYKKNLVVDGESLKKLKLTKI